MRSVLPAAGDAAASTANLLTTTTVARDGPREALGIKIFSWKAGTPVCLIRALRAE